MLAFFRRSLSSWPVLVLFGLILVAFAVTGVGDPLGGGAPAGSIAKVGERTITEPDLLQAFDRAVRRIRESNPAATQAQVAREGGVETLATQLIGQTAMEELGRVAGVSASDRAVGAEIAAIPAFQSGGKFDDATYRRVLAEQRLSDKDLRAGIAGDLVRRQLIQPVTGALSVPDGIAAAYARLLVDTYRGGVAIVPPAVAVPPTEAEIAAFYAANKLLFTVPERRALRYALIDREAIAAKVTVADDKIAAAFAKDPARYGGLATRKLEQVVVPDEAKAKAIAAAAAKDGFAAAAQAIAGFAAADIDLGEQNQAGFGKATNPAIAAAAFALPVGGITQPIKSNFGWHVVRVAGIGGSGKTLAQVRPLILAELRDRAIDDAVAALVAKVEDGVEAGQSFADIARENSLAIQLQPAVTLDGLSPSAPRLAGDALAIAAKAFRHEPADGPVVEDLGGGRLVVVETTQVQVAAPEPLAAVRPIVIAGAAQDKALKSSRAKADAIIAAVKKGGDFSAAVAAQGLKPPSPLAGRRIDIVQGQPVPQVVQAFLSTPAGTVRLLPSPQGWVLIHVAQIIPGDVKAVPGLIEASRREIASQLPAEAAEAFANASVRAVGSNRNNTTITAIKNRLSGVEAP
ncbi:SurA N-terminal domain-containing protein [Sandarakinorhabdus sp.]|uniref:SurA N-terminal domain-containing protein n=1 Tax=Sandarakinorhabdus sp. TaxID=1916663 RepID=UPI00286DF8EF|nr:SurA N-terminal domain-containing protein [Sandarakinorhabdus sp.]